MRYRGNKSSASTTQENASPPTPGPGIPATRIVKFKIGKAILQRFQATQNPVASVSHGPLNDVRNTWFGEEEGLGQSSGMSRSEKNK